MKENLRFGIVDGSLESQPQPTFQAQISELEPIYRTKKVLRNSLEGVEEAEIKVLVGFKEKTAEGEGK